MVEISEEAGQMIKETFKDKEKIPSIRIFFSEGG